MVDSHSSSQVDSNERERISEAKEELFKMLFDDSLPTPYLLVYANKQDLPTALSASELSQQLGLYSLPEEITWFTQPSCATTGEGLYEGLDWLAKTLGQHEESVRSISK